MHTGSLHLLTPISVSFFRVVSGHESILFYSLGEHIGSEGGVTCPRCWSLDSQLSFHSPISYYLQKPFGGEWSGSPQ